MTDDLRPEGVHAPMSASLPTPMADNLTSVDARISAARWRRSAATRGSRDSSGRRRPRVGGTPPDFQPGRAGGSGSGATWRSPAGR